MNISFYCHYCIEILNSDALVKVFLRTEKIYILKGITQFFSGLTVVWVSLVILLGY